LQKEQVDDVIVGNATPEAEQGLNMGRMISLMGLDTVKVPGMTVNRYCASGLETVAIASAKIHSGMAECIIAGGVESMSPIPFGGWKIVPNYKLVQTRSEEHTSELQSPYDLVCRLLLEKKKKKKKIKNNIAKNMIGIDNNSK